jgi:hypothetical protein
MNADKEKRPQISRSAAVFYSTEQALRLECLGNLTQHLAVRMVLVSR